MTWDDVRLEIQTAQASHGPHAQDVIRRKKIKAVEEVTGRPLVVYATDFTNEGRAAQYGAGLQIELDDKTGFMQALSDIPDGALDVLIHSPGGNPSATESIVHILRARFAPIRVFVPHTAKSAATMLALSGDEILLGEAAELGPIDPQFRVSNGQKSIPAGAAIDQFSAIHKEVTENPDRLRGWLPLLGQYGPSFLRECMNAVALSEALVGDWLNMYMFGGEENAKERAQKVAKWLANHSNFNSHSRPVWREQLLELEPTLKIRNFSEVDEALGPAVMALYWAIDITFDMTGAFKIIEHRAGSAYVRLQQQIAINQSPVGGQIPATRQALRQHKRKRK